MKAQKLLILLIILSTGMADRVFATAYTWGGGSTGTWNAVADWTADANFPGSTGTIDTATFNTASAVSITSLGQPSISVSGITLTSASGPVTITDGSTSDTLTLNGGSPLTLNSATTLTLDLNTTIVSDLVSNAINAGTGTVSFGTAGSSMNLALTGTRTTILENGTFNIGPEATLVGGNSSAALAANGVNGATTLNYDAAGNSGTLTSAGALTAENGGTINLQASTSLREQLTGTSGGAIYITANGVKSQGILQVTGSSGTFTIGTNISGTGKTGTFTAGLNFDNGQTGTYTLDLSAASGNTAFFTGSESNNTLPAGGVYNVVIVGSGTVVLSGINTYTGPTSVSAGSTLAVNNNLALQDSALNTSGGGVITLGSGTVTTPTFGGLTGSTNLTSSLFTSNYGSVTGITLNTQTGATNTYTGGIANGASGMSLTVTGSGTQVLGGTNLYTGATTVTGASTLTVNGSLSTGTVTVGGGATTTGSATLNGTGSIAGPVVVASAGGGIAGTITPGAGGTPGTLTVGNITFQTGSNFLDTVSGASAGTLSIGGTVIVQSGADFSVNGTLTSGDTYTVATDTGGWSGTNGGFTLSGSNLSGWQLVASGDNLVLEQAASETTGTYTLTTTVGSSVLHIGAATTATTTLANTGTGTADSLNYSGLGATANTGSVTGSTGTGGPVAQGGTAVTTQTYTATTAGTDTVTPTASSVTGANSTGTATLAGTTTASVFVYTGQGTWTGTGSGSWGTTESTSPANWAANGGIPGITPGFTTTDSAYFGSSIGSSSATVTLNGASPFLNNITFNNSAGSYTIAQGSSGTIHLDSTGTATITDTAGSHTISAPVEFDSTVSDSVASSSTLTLSGNITQSGTQSFTLNGPGTTIISGSNSYTGGTTVASGSTFISNGSNGSALGSGPLTVTAGATFGGSGSATGLSSYTIGAVSAPVTTLQVGNGTDVTSNLTLTATGASSIKNTNLAFNLNSTGASNELKVGATALTLSGDTLTLNVTTLNVITANTPYILVAGTGGNGDGTLAGSQYSGLTSGGTAANGFQLIDGLTLDFTGVGAPAGWYNNSYVFLVNNGGVDDIEVEVVPEPGTWAMMIGGLALLVFIQRRRGARNGNNSLTREKV